MLLITHDGRFHLDDVLSTAILKLLYPDASVLRTRDEAQISKGDIVYDVGSVFDPKCYRFDHHQKGFNEKIKDIKLSSSGLIYRNFFKNILDYYGFENYDEDFDFLFYSIYDEYFIFADAIDNGVDISCNIQINNKEEIIRIRSYADIVKALNYKENGFEEAVKIIQNDFDLFMKYKKIFYDQIKKNDSFVKNHNFQQIGDTRIGPNIIYVDSPDNTLLDSIYDLDRKYKKNILFLIFPDNNRYRIRALPKDKHTFKCKNPLKKEWCGLRDLELQNVSGIVDATFVHASGFTGGALSLEGAVKMCEHSILKE